MQPSSLCLSDKAAILHQFAEIQSLHKRHPAITDVCAGVRAHQCDKEKRVSDEGLDTNIDVSCAFERETRRGNDTANERQDICDQWSLK